MSITQPDGQVLERASEIVSQLLEPHPRHEQVAPPQPQQAESQLQQDQRQDHQGNVNLEQDNNAAQPDQLQAIVEQVEENPESNPSAAWGSDVSKKARFAVVPSPKIMSQGGASEIRLAAEVRIEYEYESREYVEE